MPHGEQHLSSRIAIEEQVHASLSANHNLQVGAAALHLLRCIASEAPQLCVK